MSVRRIPVPDFGDHISAEFPGDGQEHPGIFELGHNDTVWPLGELDRRPVRREKNRMTGPGIYDCKRPVS